jgi:hypothetical protein
MRLYEAIKWYAHNLFIAFDQLINALFNGWADETMSAHAYRLHRDGKPWGWLMHLYDYLFIWQTWKLDHCVRAYQAERARLHSPPETRKAP